MKNKKLLEYIDITSMIFSFFSVFLVSNLMVIFFSEGTGDLGKNIFLSFFYMSFLLFVLVVINKVKENHENNKG
ncbi:hypothetical protein [Salinicoccus albus]|uniref:hypothetical protein n=1 Tax=Salinicoccus albus TaxID=418756 RepID=UPI00036D3D1B|nr:hypothetical protein [Salinicoccus albus]